MGGLGSGRHAYGLQNQRKVAREKIDFAQRHQDNVQRFIKTVKEKDGIVEFALKGILKLGPTVYENVRKDALSFCMEMIKLDRKTRRFYYHMPSVIKRQKNV